LEPVTVVDWKNLTAGNAKNAEITAKQAGFALLFSKSFAGFEDLECRFSGDPP
jgi:hypothetical protein